MSFTDEDKRRLLLAAGWADRLESINGRRLWKRPSSETYESIPDVPDPTSDPETVLALLDKMMRKDEGVKLDGFDGNGWHVDSFDGFADWATSGEAMPLGEAVCRAWLALNE